LALTRKDDRSKVDQELRKLGFGGLDDPNLIPSIAFFVKTHEQFRGQLFSVLPEKRREAYEALRPHLRFDAKPLDVYEAEMKELAERQQIPGYDNETHQLVPFKAGSAELDLIATEAIRQKRHEDGGGVFEVVCSHCTKFEHFRAKLRKDAEKQANVAGWRSDGRKTFCPQHVPSRCTMSLICLECDKTETLRAWDQQDGFAKARIAGWTIGDEAMCPQCSTKLILVQ
jgi:hypothetical protein